MFTFTVRSVKFQTKRSRLEKISPPMTGLMFFVYVDDFVDSRIANAPQVAMQSVHTVY